MKTIQPIGLFDSGLGGLTIWKELHELLPLENTIYLADSKNAPYGQKSKEEIIELSVKNTEFLLQQNAKIIVVACNTATTNAIDYLRAHYDVPFIGIEPAIKPAAIDTKTGVIGVLATKGTLSSDLFHKAVKTHKNVKVLEQIGFGLVPLIEEGKIDAPEMTQLLKEYVLPMVEQKIDYLVLGCTHYPFLIPQLRQLLPEQVKIIDSGKAIAKQTQHILQTLHKVQQQNSHPTSVFYTNKEVAIMNTFLPDPYTGAFLEF